MRAASCKHKAAGTDSAKTAGDESKAKKTKKDELSSKAVITPDFEIPVTYMYSVVHCWYAKTCDVEK